MTRRPPHRPVRALLTHTVPTLDSGGKARRAFASGGGSRNSLILQNDSAFNSSRQFKNIGTFARLPLDSPTTKVKPTLILNGLFWLPPGIECSRE